MRKYYAGLKLNDATNCEDGICVSLWVQGCRRRCKNCHNPETWDFNSGYEVPSDIKGQIVKAISANGIERSFSILGGEPLAPENQDFVYDILQAVRTAYPNIKIYLWTGYKYGDFFIDGKNTIEPIIKNIDVLIDGEYDEEKKDITLKLRGSSNQHIYRKNEKGELELCNN